jgi:hypothetical protein
MTRRRCRLACGFLIFLSGVVGAACQLPRPRTTGARTLEPLLVAPSPGSASNPEAIPVRLLQTQARGHIARRLLHELPDGELAEDPVWRWATSPYIYLDTAMRMALSSNPSVRLVDTADATGLTVTLLAWQLADAGTQPALVGSLEVVVVGRDRTVRTQVLKDSESVSAELPGNLAAAAGRLMQRLAASSVALAAAPR